MTIRVGGQDERFTFSPQTERDPTESKEGSVERRRRNRLLRFNGHLHRRTA